MTEQPEEEIISRILKGDQSAFSQLVERYKNYVFTLVLRFTENREDAEEIAQDVFVKAYRSLADFRGDSKFSTWLFTITRTTCLSFLRKEPGICHHPATISNFELNEPDKRYIPPDC